LKLAPSFKQLFLPAQEAFAGVPPHEDRGNRPLKMESEDHLKALVYFHLEEHTSAQHLLQVLKEDKFARDNIAPDDEGDMSFDDYILQKTYSGFSDL